MSFAHISALSAGTFFCLVKRASTGQVWNKATPGWEAWNSANYANYQNATVQDGVSAGRNCQLPTGLPANETLWLVPVQSNGGEASDTQDNAIQFGIDNSGNIYTPVNLVEANGVGPVQFFNLPIPVTAVTYQAIASTAVAL